MNPLAEWLPFLAIVASAAGALIGLQFVVMALIISLPRRANNEAGPQLSAVGTAFSTPTIVHFGTVLFLAAALCAPWHSSVPVALLPALFGLAGLLYSIVITVRLRRQDVYLPQFEDWLFHSVLPLAANLALAVAAPFLLWQTRNALFAVAASLLLLLLIGIHNAWDSVTYHVFHRKHPAD
jgi:hypothetical protein